MVIRDLVGDVFRTLWAHKLRTLLTMFGIAWGIVSIVLMVAAGEGPVSYTHLTLPTICSV